MGKKPGATSLQAGSFWVLSGRNLVTSRKRDPQHRTATHRINTGTTIVTFLMVFLVQNTQKRDVRAIRFPKNAQGRLPVRWRTPLLRAQEITATCDHDLRVRHGGNVHRRDGDHHGSGDRRRRRSQSSARIRSSRDKAHSNMAPRSSRTGEMPCGSASDRDVASSADRRDSARARRWKFAALPTPSDYQQAPLKLDR